METAPTPVFCTFHQIRSQSMAFHIPADGQIVVNVLHRKRFEISSKAAKNGSPAGSSGRQLSFIHFDPCRSSRRGDRFHDAFLAN